MPRPSPLERTVSSSSHLSGRDGELTPRTPHSRSGRAEEAYNEIELEELRDDPSSSIRQPLLPTEGYRSHGDGFDSHEAANATRRSRTLALTTPRKRLPLVLGLLFVLLILLLFLIASYGAPDKLSEYLGFDMTSGTISNDNTTSNDSNATSPSTIPALLDDPLVLQYGKYNYTDFPLDSREYEKMCVKLYHGYMLMPDYWTPSKMGIVDVVHHDKILDITTVPVSERVCSSTVTYMLDKYVGLSAELAFIAQTAALARERNRTFFIDDSKWDRGKWTDFFQDVRKLQPGPEPDCIPPEPEELVACPRLARHWVVTARTSRFHFAHGFLNHYENAYAIQLNRAKPVYDMAQESFKTVILPNDRTKTLIDRSRKLLGNILQDRHKTFAVPAPGSVSAGDETDNPASKFGGTSYMAVHIRRGDRKSTWMDYSTNGGFVPLEDYAAALRHRWHELYLQAHPGQENSIPDPIIYIASDSPQAMREFEKIFPVGTTFSLDGSGDKELAHLASITPYVQDEFSLFTAVDKERYTRGMIVDFAMLGGFWADGALQPDSVTCTISSNVCRLAAVGLGWSRAFGNVPHQGDIDTENARWLEVEDKNRIYPTWKALEVFY